MAFCVRRISIHGSKNNPLGLCIMCHAMQKFLHMPIVNAAKKNTAIERDREKEKKKYQNRKSQHKFLCKQRSIFVITHAWYAETKGRANFVLFFFCAVDQHATTITATKLTTIFGHVFFVFQPIFKLLERNLENEPKKKCSVSFYCLAVGFHVHVAISVIFFLFLGSFNSVFRCICVSGSSARSVLFREKQCKNGEIDGVSSEMARRAISIGRTFCCHSD